jgi:hypothetical protein
MERGMMPRTPRRYSSTVLVSSFWADWTLSRLPEEQDDPFFRLTSAQRVKLMFLLDRARDRGRGVCRRAHFPDAGATAATNPSLNG